MGAMRHQKSVGIEVEPLYCKVNDPLPHGTSRLSRFRFGQSVPTPFLCGLKPTKTEELFARKHDESHVEDMQSNTNDSSICADSFVWCTYAIGGLPSGFFRLHFLPSAHGKKLIGFQVLMQYKRFLRRL